MSDSDSDSSSDMDAMFDKAKTAQQQVPEKTYESDADSGSDDDDYISNRKKSLGVEAQFNILNQDTQIRDRKRRAKRALEAGSDDDDDDSIEANDANGASLPTRKSSRRVDKNAVKVSVEISRPDADNANDLLLGSDSDSDDDVAQASKNAPPASLSRLKEQGASEAQLAHLTTSRAAIADLLKAQQYTAQDVQVPIAVDPQMMYLQQVQQMQALQQQQQYNPHAAAILAAALMGQQHQPLAALANSTLHLTIRARLDRIGFDSQHRTVAVTMQQHETFRVLAERFVAALGVQAVVTMTYQGHVLINSRTPMQTGLQDGAILDAVAQLTGLVFQDANAPVVAAPVVAPNLGREISVTLRRQTGKQTQQVDQTIRMRQPLQALVDQYAASQGVRVGSVVFMFDGQRMDMNQTPVQYDMDDEDLIDVVLH